MLQAPAKRAAQVVVLQLQQRYSSRALKPAAGSVPCRIETPGCMPDAHLLDFAGLGEFVSGILANGLE